MTALRVVDLFAGAGGLSLGFEQAGSEVDGIEVVLAVESNAKAVRTYQANHPGTVVLHETISKDWDVVERLKEHLEDPTCDVLIGGPPCQGWSTLGGRGNKERRMGLNACVDYFVAQVRSLRPAAVVMENVRGLAVKDGGKHLKRVLRQIRRMGYWVRSYDVRAADFGVPQLRHRVFVVGLLKELGIRYELHKSHGPEEWLTVWDAIGDLPSLAAGSSATEYAAAPRNDFQRRMREGSETLTWQEAPDHSPEIREVLRALRGEGASRADIEDKVTLTTGFHNTYCRLRSDMPAPAVTSSAGRVSSGRNAHPRDDRALTPREAARLQSFPDRYRWEAERWPVYEQVGNAVPPALAEAVAVPLLRRLGPVLG